MIELAAIAILIVGLLVIDWRLSAIHRDMKRIGNLIWEASKAKTSEPPG